jgi:ADP-ribose pyrophosphatase YjhB (NUDIX family)
MAGPRATHAGPGPWAGVQRGGKVKREFPEQPVVGVGGVVVRGGRALLIRRGGEPRKGEWSIPGGTLELGESLEAGVRRELREETGLDVSVLELIEVFERIIPADGGSAPAGQIVSRPRYHFVIADYLCAAAEGEPRAGSDVTAAVFASEEDLPRFRLTPTATRVIRRALAMARARGL